MLGVGNLLRTMQMMSECPKTRPVDGLTALAPRLHRNGSLLVERWPSGTCRVVLRFRERIGERLRRLAYGRSG